VRRHGQLPVPGESSICRVGLAESDRRQASATLDVELSIGVGGVHLDSLHGDEQRLSDLGVGSAVGSHPRDALLARRQRIGS
jgi:hypothetical protein